VSAADQTPAPAAATAVRRAPDRFRWLAGAAAAALAAGLLLSVQSLVRLSADLHRIERRAADLTALRRLEAGWREDRQAVRQFEQLASHQPAPLAELVAKNVPSGTHAIRQRESVPAADGWTLRRAEVKLDGVRLAEISALLAAAERSRPPWRLAEFYLLAPETAGTGRATLVCEALEKKDAAAPAATHAPPAVIAAPLAPVLPTPATPPTSAKGAE